MGDGATNHTNQDNSDSEDESSQTKEVNGNVETIGDSTLQDVDQKDPTAVDYSDINELIEDTEAEKYPNHDGGTDYDADDEDGKCDNKLMPPPPAPSDVEMDANEQKEVNKRRLETPLAAMLPSKYADVDVTELFPDFRADKVGNFNLVLVKKKWF